MQKYCHTPVHNTWHYCLCSFDAHCSQQHTLGVLSSVWLVFVELPIVVSIVHSPHCVNFALTTSYTTCCTWACCGAPYSHDLHIRVACCRCTSLFLQFCVACLFLFRITCFAVAWFSVAFFWVVFTCLVTSSSFRCMLSSSVSSPMSYIRSCGNEFLVGKFCCTASCPL